jgi:hypothetical protein
MESFAGGTIAVIVVDVTKTLNTRPTHAGRAVRVRIGRSWFKYGVVGVLHR